MARESSKPNRLLSLSCFLLSLLVGSCAAPSTADKKEKVPTAAMDVAMDSGGRGMFYDGTARIPRGFNSASSFNMTFALSHWGHPAEDDAGRNALATLGSKFNGTGTYQPLGGGQGVISIADGRLLLRGKVLKDGQELDGDWFFDGKAGGGFRIAPKGHIFP